MKASEIESILKTRPDGERQTSARKSHTRRPRLTLFHIHRLRLMHELKKLEAAEKQKFVSDMYGGTFEESDEKPKDSKNPPKSLKPLKPSKPSKPSSKYLDKYTRS